MKINDIAITTLSQEEYERVQMSLVLFPIMYPDCNFEFGVSTYTQNHSNAETANSLRSAIRNLEVSIYLASEVYVMYPNEQLGITIPKQLLDELAEEIAVKVSSRLKAHIHQLVSAIPEPPAFEEPRIKPTFLRIREVAERVGFSRGGIYKKMSEGKFPQSVKLGERSVAWRLTDIEIWERNPLGYSHK
jgi:prophage regulatory protein